MFRKESKPQNRIDSLIGATTRIEGNVFFSGGLRVDGAVRGNVAALPDQPGTLVVSEHARIDGEVQANSRVKGDIHYKSIEIQQGAVIEGRLVHLAAEVKGVELKVAK